jgi:hypothetical protein
MSLSLGLMPWFSEPHVWGKLKWIAGGANGMQLLDYFDLVMHGAPWIYLIVSIFLMVKKRPQKQ